MTAEELRGDPSSPRRGSVSDSSRADRRARRRRGGATGRALPLLSTELLVLWQRRVNHVLRLEDYYARVASRGPWRRRRRPSGDSIATSKQLHVVYSCGWPTPGSAKRLSPGAPLAEFDLNRATDAARALAVLVEARLVVVSDEMAEVAHEAVLREWPRLRDWLEEDAHGRRLHRHLTQTSTAWDEVVVTRAIYTVAPDLPRCSTGPLLKTAT